MGKKHEQRENIDKISHEPEGLYNSSKSEKENANNESVRED